MKTVFLSAGHGGKDPGAVAFGLKEEDINLAVLLSCKSELERHGVKVIASRIKDENDPKEDEVREANASGASVAVSIHVNAGGGDGFEAFYFTGSLYAKNLAKLCEKHVKSIGQNSRGIKSGNHLYWCKKTKMPSVLVECFFIDSNDRFIGDEEREQKSFGVAFAKAILEYLGITYKGAGTVTEKDVIEIIKAYEAEKAKEAVGTWAAASWEKAKKKGVMDGTMPKSPLTREQFAVILDRLGELD